MSNSTQSLRYLRWQSYSRRAAGAIVIYHNLPMIFFFQVMTGHVTFALNPPADRRSARQTAPPLLLEPGTVKRVDIGAQFNPIRH